MNMTEKFEHDRKDHTDKHERWNLTENVLQRQTLTGEYDRNYFDLKWLFNLSRCCYQIFNFSDIKILFIYFNVLMI